MFSCCLQLTFLTAEFSYNFFIIRPWFIIFYFSLLERDRRWSDRACVRKDSLILQWYISGQIFLPRVWLDSSEDSEHTHNNYSSIEITLPIRPTKVLFSLIFTIKLCCVPQDIYPMKVEVSLNLELQRCFSLFMLVRMEPLQLTLEQHRSELPGSNSTFSNTNTCSTTQSTVGFESADTEPWLWRVNCTIIIMVRFSTELGLAIPNLLLFKGQLSITI